jgi:hypothetical protein
MKDRKKQRKKRTSGGKSQEKMIQQESPGSFCS